MPFPGANMASSSGVPSFEDALRKATEDLPMGNKPTTPTSQPTSPTSQPRKAPLPGRVTVLEGTRQGAIEKHHHGSPAGGKRRSTKGKNAKFVQTDESNFKHLVLELTAMPSPPHALGPPPASSLSPQSDSWESPWHQPWEGSNSQPPSPITPLGCASTRGFHSGPTSPVDQSTLSSYQVSSLANEPFPGFNPADYGPAFDDNLMAPAPSPCDSLIGSDTDSYPDAIHDMITEVNPRFPAFYDSLWELVP